MKKYIWICFFSILAVHGYGQVEDTPSFVGKYFGNQSGGGAGYWEVTGNFTDESGYYDATNIAIGDMLFFADSGKGYHLPVTNIVSASGSSFTIRVNNTGITGVAGVPNQSGAIYRPSTTKLLFPYTSGITNSDQQTLNSYLIEKIESISSGGITDSLKIGAFPIKPLDTIYFFGNSITAGVGASVTAKRFSTILTNLLGIKEKNRGIAGSTMTKEAPVDPFGVASVNMIDRLWQVPVKGANSKYIVCAYGQNDAGYTDYDTVMFKRDYRRFLDTCLARGWSASDIHIITPGYMTAAGRTLYTTNPANSGNPALTLSRQLLYNNAVSAIAAQKGVNFVDLWNACINTYVDTTNFMGADRIHPGDDGHAFMALTLMASIQGNAKNIPGDLLDVNGNVRLKNLRIENPQLLTSGFVLGQGENGNIGVFQDKEFVKNNVTSVSQNTQINILKTVVNNYTPITDVEKILVNGGIRGSFLRASGALPGGLTGSAVEIGMVGSTGFIGAYNRTSSATLPLALSGLGSGQIIIGGLTASGIEGLNATTGFKSTYIRAVGGLPGGLAGEGIETWVSGSTGYLNVYNRTSSTALPLILQFSGGLIGIGTVTPTAWLHLPAGTTGNASLRVPSGVAPTSPNEGDVWNDGTNPKYRTGSVTYDLMKSFSGTGSPEGVVTTTIGHIYRRTDGSVGTSVYFKETGSGNTGWVAMKSASQGAANGVISTTTDASGDITVTIPTMPDVTYTVNVQITGTTLYNTTVHTKTTTSFKVRSFAGATGLVLGAGVTVDFDYDVKDY